MRSERAVESKWMTNLKKSIISLINEQKRDRRVIKELIMTEGIYSKLAKEIGYDPIDFLGYKIKILEQTRSQLEEEGDLVLVQGEALN